ncbi:MAG: GYF domain-containing protein [Planctomycetaceae bacterium]
MNTPSSTWYIWGEGNKPLGPFAPEQLIESWHARGLDPNTLGWQEGMAEWLPLAVLQPFASTMREERRSARLRNLRRIAVGLLIIVVLAAIGGVGYLRWTESAMIAHGKQLIAAGHYEEASTLLEPLTKQCAASLDLEQGAANG